MDHSLSWLVRKYKQAMKEQYEKSSARVVEGYKSVLLVMDTLFNNGKDYEKILPSYETMISSREDDEAEKKFVNGQWWIK